MTPFSLPLCITLTPYFRWEFSFLFTPFFCLRPLYQERNYGVKQGLGALLQVFAASKFENPEEYGELLLGSPSFTVTINY